MRAGLTGWADIDREELKKLSIDEQIDWFEYRVRLVVVKPLALILDTQITADPTSSALLIFGVSLCCAIEAMGKFLRGNVRHDERFEAFISDYMSDELKTGEFGGVRYKDILRDHFRNGLAHGFTVCHGGFNGGRGGRYFEPKQNGSEMSLLVNPVELFDDFVAGLDRYIKDLRAGDPKLAMFKTVFESVFIDGK
jgi:hypothetical protein